MEANANFRLPNYVLSKVATPMNSTPAFDENPELSKYTTWPTQYLGEILHFQRQMFVKGHNLRLAL